jgi:hypothetical protein
MLAREPIDPVCAFHGKRASEHVCLYCCLCFETMTPEECWRDEAGQRWDVHPACHESDLLAFEEANRG